MGAASSDCTLFTGAFSATNLDEPGDIYLVIDWESDSLYMVCIV